MNFSESSSVGGIGVVKQFLNPVCRLRSSQFVQYQVGGVVAAAFDHIRGSSQDISAEKPDMHQFVGGSGYEGGYGETAEQIDFHVQSGDLSVDTLSVQFGESLSFGAAVQAAQFFPVYEEKLRPERVDSYT